MARRAQHRTLKTPPKKILLSTPQIPTQAHTHSLHPATTAAPSQPLPLPTLSREVDPFLHIKFFLHCIKMNNINGHGGRRSAMASMDFYRRVPKDLTEVSNIPAFIRCPTLAMRYLEFGSSFGCASYIVNCTLLQIVGLR